MAMAMAMARARARSAVSLLQSTKQQNALLLTGRSRIGFENPLLLLSTFSSDSAPASSVPPPSAASAEKFTGDRERGTLSKLLLFLPGAVTFGLGTWQIVRRQEKIEMIDYRRKRLEKEPVMWNNLSLSGEDMTSFEFRKVCCEGWFDESKNIYVGPRSRSISGVTENGYYVITPLVPTSSNPNSQKAPILVNRGWVPREWRKEASKNARDSKEPSTPAVTDDEDKESITWWKFWSKKPSALEIEESYVPPVKVVGVIRGSEKPSIFVPENDPHSGQWFYVDVPMVARACSLSANTVYIEDTNEDINPSNPYPLPKDVNSLIRHSVMPQDHMNYTLTWYTLSAAVTYMAFKRIRTSKSRR